VSRYDVSDPGGRELLTQVCKAADRAAEMRAVIDRDGLTVDTKHGIREHPLLKHELAAQAFMTRTLNRLLAAPRQSVGRPTDQSTGPRSAMRVVKP
jgi:hypothetical protein